MRTPAAYLDLMIRISASRSRGRPYAVEATIDGDSFFFGGVLDLDFDELLAGSLDNRIYGGALREALFSKPIERAYRKARTMADEKTEGRLRLRLQIDPDASALHALRWERLLLPAGNRDVPLSISGKTPFSRYISRESAITEPLTRRPIHMVVAISSPSRLPAGMAHIDIEQELASLRLSLQEVRSPGKLRITVVPGSKGISASLREQLQRDGCAILEGPTTLEVLQQQLLACDLFHFLGHGSFAQGQPAGSAALYLEKPDGSVDVARDDEIVSRLGDGSSVPRLVFLAACESALRSRDSLEPFVGLGPKLVQAGVPAVVSMQDLVPMNLAQALTHRFYRGLLAHGRIDQALNDARLTLFENHHADWSIPVLFMRIRNGRLFAPDPLLTLLEKIAKASKRFLEGKEPPLPLDVVRIAGDKERGTLLRLAMDTTPGGDFKLAVREIFAKRRGDELRLAVLLGGAGTAKSFHLQHLAGVLAKKALAAPSPPATVPVYAHLSNYTSHKLGFQDSFHSFLLESLRQLSPGLTDQMFSQWLEEPQGPTFLFMIDGSERLDDNARSMVLEQFEKFAGRHRRHCFLLVCDLSHFTSPQLTISDFLVVKPMSRSRLKTYLQALRDKEGQSLYGMLAKAGLFDLAAVPWILVRILGQVRRGIVPRSRTGVLANLVAEMLAKLPNEKGIRTRAARTLSSLAWEMQNSRRLVLSVSRAFRIMDAARGHREYELEYFLSRLIYENILTPVGDDALRFAYSGLRAWFAAQALNSIPDRNAVLDDITATLGRLSRSRWWEDTLVLLAGSVDDVNILLRQILNCGSLTTGDQVFLAARCMQEAGAGRVADELHGQVTNALVRISSSSYEPRATRRQHAIRTLGKLKVESAVPHLVNLALERVRTSWDGHPAFEYSSVRLAAVEALRYMESVTSRYVATRYPDFGKLLVYWLRQDISALENQLNTATIANRAVAAFVLGNIASPPAARVLLATFRKPGVDAQTRWAITDSLLKLEPARVTHSAILPFIDATAAKAANLPKETWKKRQHWYERVVYLIGHINPSDPRAGVFLERCLYKFTGVWLKARTIRAIGKMADSRYKDLLEDISRGDFGNIALGNLKKGQATYLRYVAIHALAGIGDRQTLTLLQRQDDGSNPELQAAHHSTSEEIAWRLFERSHASATPPEMHW